MFIRKRSEVIKRFLVLSDLHIVTDKNIEKGSEEDAYHRFDSSLVSYLSAQSEKLDYILICGDLTDKNCKKGYTRLNETLQKLISKGIISSATHIVCCPGNHDQNRAKIASTLKLIQDGNPNDRSKNSNILYEKSLLEYLSTMDDSFERISEIHNEKFEEYNSFIENLYHFKKDKRERTQPGFTLNLDNELLITSINSSWYCDFPDNRQADEGSLILGINYVKESMKVVDFKEKINKIPRITILHHPPEAYTWHENYGTKDEINSMKYITNNSSLVISGHVHGLPRTMGYVDDAYLISNGTSYNQGMQMSFLQFDLNIHNGEVELYEYQFDKDKIITPQPHHYQTFRAPLINCEDLQIRE